MANGPDGPLCPPGGRGGRGRGPTNVAWLGVCAALFALLALVWPLAESRGAAVTETRDAGAVTAFTYLRWRAVRAFLPGAILMGAAAVLLGYAIVRRLVVGGSPDSTTKDAAFGIAGGVLIIALAVGYWILVARALRPRTLALSPAGIHLSAAGRVVPWRDVSDVVAESRVVKHAMRLPDDSAPYVVIWTQKGDRVAVRLDNFSQHPCVILGMLTAYAAHPTLRPELGTPLAVERSRAMTAALADLRTPAGHRPG